MRRLAPSQPQPLAFLLDRLNRFRAKGLVWIQLPSPAMVGRRLRRLRRRKGWSQARLAKRIGVSQPYLSQLERGADRNPTLKVLQRLAKALKIPIADLVEGKR